MSYVKPSVADFKLKYTRDFPFGTSLSTVTDTDISNAFLDADLQLNTSLFPDQTSYTNGYLLLAAHNLVMNIRASSQGISGNFEWLVQNKSVGAVSEGLAIPERILANPIFAMYTKTTYGAKYLLFVLPYLTGTMYATIGTTQP